MTWRPWCWWLRGWGSSRTEPGRQTAGALCRSPVALRRGVCESSTPRVDCDQNFCSAARLRLAADQLRRRCKSKLRARASCRGASRLNACASTLEDLEKTRKKVQNVARKIVLCGRDFSQSIPFAKLRRLVKFQRKMTRFDQHTNTSSFHLFAWCI